MDKEKSLPDSEKTSFPKQISNWDRSYDPNPDNGGLALYHENEYGDGFDDDFF